MKIATWNINSVRLRIDLVKKFINIHTPDILCLQEIKCKNENFPYKAMQDMGYKYLHIFGQKGYHGVAIASKIPFKAQNIHSFMDEDGARYQSVLLENDIELHNFYIPAGGDEPDILMNPKFAHKLNYVKACANHFQNIYINDNPKILVGDFNIAPLPDDVWSHKQLLKIISHTPIEVDHLNQFLASAQFIDVLRHYYPAPQKLYSWWSYRAKDWKLSNRGRRLDHIWVTQNLQPKLKNAYIYTEPRSWERPSDHVPVICEFNL
jgi:exodeoxyribonuclease-3